MNCLRILVICLFFGACSSDDASPNENEITVGYEQTVAKTIKGKSWVVDFDEVNENSLCPENSVCVWQGRIVVSVEINGRVKRLGLGDLRVADGEEEINNSTTLDDTIITFIKASGTEESSTTQITLRFD